MADNFQSDKSITLFQISDENFEIDRVTVIN